VKSALSQIATALWCVVVFPFALAIVIVIHAFNAFAGDPPDPDEHD
jgi:hypothetical protein